MLQLYSLIYADVHIYMCPKVKWWTVPVEVNYSKAILHKPRRKALT